MSKRKFDFGWVVIAIIMIARLWPISPALAIFLTVGILAFFGLTRYRKQVFAIIQKINVGAFLTVIFLGLVSLIVTITYFGKAESQVEDQEPIVEEHPDIDPIRILLDTTDEWHPDHTSDPVVDWVSHLHDWKGPQEIGYQTNFKVRQSDWDDTKIKKQLMQVPYDGDDIVYWGNVYKGLYEIDSAKLDDIYQRYAKLQKTYDLDRVAFAKVIVSSVQYIPYNLVLMNACDENLYSGSTKQLLKNGTPCVPNVKYGVHSPVEFMGTFKGDCDTRTTFLYTVLRHFNYDVAILGSMAYLHSVLGINLPMSGKYVKHNGKKYYVWETTYHGFEPGVISPMWGDMDKWDVDLEPY